MNSEKLIVIQLNEINFDLVKKYVDDNKRLPNFKKLFDSFNYSFSTSEKKYNHLEPWIQWVSANTGKSYEEHKVFRLGDITNTENLPQIFEKLESMGLKVGAISPMNAKNNLKKPVYFIPDPWTDTEPDNSDFSRRIDRMLSQTVNDNSQGKISFSSFITLIEMVIKSIDIKNIFYFISMVTEAVFRKKWIKPMVLDYLIHKLHIKLIKDKSPDVSFIFLNGGAHIQHHYMHNSPYIDSECINPDWYVPSSEDPFFDMLKIYDEIIGEYVKNNNKIILATGLTQTPFEKSQFYWRLKDHKKFLSRLGVKYIKILPRMTRDFEVFFNNKLDQEKAIKILKELRLARDNKVIFEDIEVRKRSIFVTLTYPDEIIKSDHIKYNEKTINIYEHLTFVAIKNGMHNEKGYVFTSKNIKEKFVDGQHIKSLFQLILNSISFQNKSSEF
tara:strand:+ start:11153 stop:12478 length:1326 start_codon:yes stop_codon:yes gene_type:complete